MYHSLTLHLWRTTCCLRPPISCSLSESWLHIDGIAAVGTARARRDNRTKHRCRLHNHRRRIVQRRNDCCIGRKVRGERAGMPAARGASGVQLVGVCWYRGPSRRGDVAIDCAGAAESAPAEHKLGVAVARVNTIMPQRGKSIAEGTLSRWLKKVGEEVKRDEPIFEISTDKVDAEIPAPSNGVLAEILVTEGQTVAVGTVVARLETDKAAFVRGEGPAGDTPAPAP